MVDYLQLTAGEQQVQTDTRNAVTEEFEERIAELERELATARGLKIDMQRWIDHHNERADKARS